MWDAKRRRTVWFGLWLVVLGTAILVGPIADYGYVATFFLGQLALWAKLKFIGHTPRQDGGRDDG